MPTTLRSNSQWDTIEEEICRVTDFVPLGDTYKEGRVQTINSSTPYASVTLECRKFPEKIIGFICHKVDFTNLWLAVKEKRVKDDEEMLIIWSKKHYKRLYKPFAFLLPKLWVMICPKGAYELMIDNNYKPELSGMARWEASKLIEEWKPDVMAS